METKVSNAPPPERVWRTVPTRYSPLNCAPTPVIFSVTPALTLGFPGMWASASTYAVAMRLSVALARASTSRRSTAEELEMWIAPPPRSLETLLRPRPIFESSVDAPALLENNRFPFGSHAFAVTVFTCWAPVTRGWKEAIVSGHSSSTVSFFTTSSAGRNRAFLPSISNQ